ncbi:transglutaminase-like cysteine peptidase [Amorphus sp. 3PC139-8]
MVSAAPACPARLRLATWLLAILAAVGAPSAAEATSSFMPLSDPTEAPEGYVEFCTRFPVDCRPAKKPSRAVVLTDERWVELVETNRSVNAAVRPVTDRAYYGRSEFWTYPIEAGDCEDYVLLKRRLLMEKGWPASVLLITVVRDENGEGHAVLTVGTDRGDLILDNRTDTVLPWALTLYHYVKRQEVEDPSTWVRIIDQRGTSAVGSIRPQQSPPARTGR